MSKHIITLGGTTFGLDQGKCSYSTPEVGSVNQRWGSIKPGQTYRTELMRQINNSKISTEVHKIVVITISSDGGELAIEAFDELRYSNRLYSFQEGQLAFYC